MQISKIMNMENGNAAIAANPGALNAITINAIIIALLNKHKIIINKNMQYAAAIKWRN